MTHLQRIVLFTLLLAVPAGNLHAQTFDVLLKQGKALVKKINDDTTAGDPDFQPAITVLERAVKMNPRNQEAHYFLGSAYDYREGTGEFIKSRTLAGTIKASNELETVIRIAPKYKGELLFLDPFTKLNSIWGSMALCYQQHGDKDSMRWALQEGKRRGAFSEFALGYYRYALDQCLPNAIVVSSGDFSTFTFIYLQFAEGYRKDVTIVNQSMLQNPWYARLMYDHDHTLFASREVANDTDPYIEWEPSTVKVPIRNTEHLFTWQLNGREDRYLFRNDIMLKAIITHNGFVRPFYVEAEMDPDDLIGLKNYFQDQVLLSQLLTQEAKLDTGIAGRILAHLPQSTLNKVNLNSDIERFNVNMLRVHYLHFVAALAKLGDFARAKESFVRMDRAMPLSKVPLDDYTKEYYGRVKDWIYE